MQTIAPAASEAHEIIAEEIEKLKKEQLRMYGKVTMERQELDSQVELLRHVLRRIHEEVK